MTSEEQLLVTENLSLVHYLVRKNFFDDSNKSRYDDLVSAGTMGLIKASKSYNPEKSTFATFASRCIINEVLMYMRVNDKPKRNKITIMSLEETPTSLRFTRDTEDLTYGTMVADPRDFIEEFVDRETLKYSLSKLKTKDIILLKMIFEQELSQNEVAVTLGISQSYVSRRTRNIIKRLKNIAGEQDTQNERSK